MYSILGKDIYIMTSFCLSLAVADEVVLDMYSMDVGEIYENGNQCMVKGLYKKIDLR